MSRIFNEGKKFENKGFQQIPLEEGDYESCTFINCDLSGSDLSDINFFECEFLECNLSLVKLTQTSFREAKFKNCKLLGLHFEECNSLILSLSFEGCSLDLCSFNKLKLKNTLFKNKNLVGCIAKINKPCSWCKTWSKFFDNRDFKFIMFSW